MYLIIETIEQLQVYSCLQSYDGEVFSELFDEIDDLVIMMHDPSKTQVNITSQWSKCINIPDNLKKH